VRPVTYLTAVAIFVCRIAGAQQPPTFGTTVVVPGGLIGVVYHIRPFATFLPDFPSLDPAGIVYTSSLNVPPHNFRDGFPGLTSRLEWFAIDYRGRFWVQKPGVYRFALTSDAGSRLYIDDDLTVDNDGLHDPEVKNGSRVLSGGVHSIRVSYFQGPRECVALILQVAGSGEQFRIFSTDEFKPPPDPETWGYPDSSRSPALRVSPVAAARGDTVKMEVSLELNPGQEVVGLQWDLVVPAQLLEMMSVGPGTGRSAADSGKLLKCSAQSSYLFACSLAGGQKPITSGPIATFNFKIGADARLGTTAVHIENAKAVTLDQKKFNLKDIEGAVTLH